MFPLGDDNPRLRTPWATALLIGLNIVAWATLQGFGTLPALEHAICVYGLIPGELLGHVTAGTSIPLRADPVTEDALCTLSGASRPLTLLTSMFLHGSWFHIIGNLWFLYVFGDNVEDILGPVRFTLFYLLCGVAAAVVQIATNPESPVPMVGASGAISGIMGAYALLFPGIRVRLLVVLGVFITTLRVPAVVVLGYWLLLQFVGGLPALDSTEGGVAFWAHIGGFLAGLIIILPLARLPNPS